MPAPGIIVPGAPSPVGHYPHARRVGDLLFLSGIGPRDPATNAIPNGIEAQTRAVFANVRAVLEASGACWESLVDVTVAPTAAGIQRSNRQTTLNIQANLADKVTVPDARKA